MINFVTVGLMVVFAEGGIFAAPSPVLFMLKPLNKWLKYENVENEFYLARGDAIVNNVLNGKVTH